jgi:WS/DGAT C-terminal domain
MSVAVFVTNLRGPEQQATLVGAWVREVVPVTTTTGSVPVVFAALSYAGVLTLTVVADPDTDRNWTRWSPTCAPNWRRSARRAAEHRLPGGSAAAPVARLMTPSHR